MSKVSQGHRKEGVSLYLSPLSSLLGGVAAFLNGMGTLAIIGLMVLINTDIGGRALLNAPVHGVPEMVSLSIVGIVFLQLGHTLRKGRLTRSEALSNFLHQRSPRLSAFLDGIFNLTGLVLLGILAYSSWPLFVKSWEGDIFVGSIGDFTAPVWPIKLIIVVGSTVTAIQFFEAALRSFYGAFSGNMPDKSVSSSEESSV